MSSAYTSRYLSEYDATGIDIRSPFLSVMRFMVKMKRSSPFAASTASAPGSSDPESRGAERLSPILMTALTAGLALIRKRRAHH